MGFNAVTKNWIVEENYFRGSGYMLYITEGGYIMKNNKFLGDYRWGPMRFFNDGREYGEWSNNTDENGNIISAP